MIRLRNILIAVAALIVLINLGRCVWLGMRTDEERIRALLEEIIDTFNDGGIGGIAAATAEDYRHENPALDRNEVLTILRGVVLRNRDTVAKRFGHRLDMVPGATIVEVEDESAEVSMTLETWRSSGGEWKNPRTVVVSIMLEKRAGDWRIVSTALKWVRGSPQRRNP